MEKPNLQMTLRECLLKFPELQKSLYQLIGECVYCEGFKDEPLEDVFKAHRIEPQEGLQKLIKALGEE